MADAERRSPGRGSLYQRQDGRWVAAVTLPDGRRRSRYAATEREAHRSLDALRATLRAGRPVPPARLTVGRYLRTWLDTTAAASVRASTLRRYALDVDRITAALGWVRLGELTATQVTAFLAAVHQGGLSARSTAHCRAVLRVALHEAQRDELVLRNAAALARVPQAPPAERRAITAAEARAVLAACSGHWLAPLVATAMGTGLRRGELLGLGWDDLDLDQALLRVRVQLQHVAGLPELQPLKTAGSAGRIALPASVVGQLRALRAEQAEARLRLGPAWQDTGRVFCGADGRYRDGISVYRAFQRRVRDAGLPPLRWHDLRHITGSVLHAQGIGDRTVMEVLRHSQIATTAQTYQHVVPATLYAAAAALERAIWPADEGDAVNGAVSHAPRTACGAQNEQQS